jgi:hypothetical protein
MWVSAVRVTASPLVLSLNHSPTWRVSERVGMGDESLLADTSLQNSSSGPPGLGSSKSARCGLPQPPHTIPVGMHPVVRRCV